LRFLLPFSQSAALWEQVVAQTNHWAAFVAGYRAIGYDQAGFELIFQ
jgi:hypothetical protein